jgi:hypothetical protein
MRTLVRPVPATPSVRAHHEPVKVEGPKCGVRLRQYGVNFREINTTCFGKSIQPALMKSIQPTLLQYGVATRVCRLAQWRVDGVITARLLC